MLSNKIATPVLYIDLDGTVRHGFDELGRFVNSIEDVVIFDAALKRLKEYKSAGYRIVAVTNQGGIAMGFMSEEVGFDILNRTNELCEELFDIMVMCVHHPDCDDPSMANCFCRKPKIGMLIAGSTQLMASYPNEWYPPNLSIMVGDREEDRQCASNAGIEFIDADQWRNSCCGQS